ncbi:ComEA family DNA-binding protein [Zhihengliuella salsuginis]|uniref:Helix-hairpin-helix DNA-binding motif class 1 domain-containing protein n=1 Tax=Zhihengliuella salsuginis TaxID=578222 RepID=A0ABQ3GCY8_9MICC|nr:ComEA family DNA-binding protein [Zhihengliuella salsuginis]GHD02064.1 hypothetical protein GCM10008096_06910 [Zhihengliuella salsuginis]
MVRHRWQTRDNTRERPSPARVRWSLGRGALVCLAVGVIVWIGVSLVVRPWVGGGREIETVELDERPQTSAASPTASPTGSPTASPQSSRDSDQQPAAEDVRTVLVHVVGAVQEPGVYELDGGARALEALEAAGGATGEAATEGVNLAAEVADGQQIWIPTRDEAGRMPAPPPAGGTTGGAEGAAFVNVNTAGAAQLEELPGIGPALAGRIIDFRERNGPYQGIADLDAVSGIGPVLLEQLGDVVEF